MTAHSPKVSVSEQAGHEKVMIHKGRFIKERTAKREKTGKLTGKDKEAPAEGVKGQ